VTVTIDSSTRLSLLYISNNQLKNLNLVNNLALLELRCNSNKLATIDLSKNVKLRYLDVSNNTLLTLDLCNNIEILKLICVSNNIAKITIPKKIQPIFANNNVLIDSKTSYSTCD
jgi:Leucine-rich repeat (LRR) protein